MTYTFFQRLESGKVLLYEEEMNLIRIKEDKHYVVNNSMLETIKKHTDQIPKGGLIYGVMGWTADMSRGAISKIKESELVETIQDISRNKNIIINPKI